jgi:hypothetical protein
MTNKHPVLAGVDETQFREYLAGLDGETIWQVEKFIEMGFDKAFVDGVAESFSPEVDFVPDDRP